jgi:hypothetical protein
MCLATFIPFPTPGTPSFSFFSDLIYNNPVQRDCQYWLRLTKLTSVVLAVGPVGGVAGYVLLSSALHVHALAHPGCGRGVVDILAGVGIEDVQTIAHLDGVFP